MTTTAPATSDLHTMTPREFDTELAAVYKEAAKAAHRLDSCTSFLHRTVGDTRVGHSRSVWNLSDAQAERKAQEMAEDEARMAHVRAEVTRALVHVWEARQAVEKGLKETSRYGKVFWTRGGWSRFFLVRNANGHIHSSMECSTCRPTTEFSWLPDVSGKTEKDAVDEHGALLCTVCFPSAPVEWTNHWEKEAERKQAESCPGSGTFEWVEGTVRLGYSAGNGGTCSHCNRYAAATSIGKIRKHKPGK